MGHPASRGYGDVVRKDPEARESRVPATAIWTVAGLMLGLAFGVVISSVAVPVIIGAVVGLLFGLFTTRTRFTPEDD